MRVVIVGVDHELQTREIRTVASNDLPKAEARDKAKYRTLIKALAAEGRVGLIGEEHLPPPDTIAREVAKDLGCPHSYIEMSLQERAKRGIPRGYHGDTALSDVEKKSFDARRELFWVNRIEDLTPNESGAVVICGADHILGLSGLFQQNGHVVQAINVLRLPGFDLRWLGPGV